jgi:uncharacterized membrane protein
MSKKPIKLQSALELFNPSVAILQQHPLIYFVLLVLPVLFVAVDSIAIVGVLLTIVFTPALFVAELKNANGKTIALVDAFKEGYKYFWRIIGLGIIVGVLVIIGLFLFIVPGLVVLRRYALSPYYLIDQNLSIKSAMEKAAQQTKPYEWDMYNVIALSILLGLIGLLGLAGLIVGTILQVLYSLAFVLRYYEIKKASKA